MKLNFFWICLVVLICEDSFLEALMSGISPERLRELLRSLRMRRVTFHCDFRVKNLTQLRNFFRSEDGTFRWIGGKSGDDDDGSRRGGIANFRGGIYDEFGGGVACLRKEVGSRVLRDFSGDNFSEILSGFRFATKESWVFLTPDDGRVGDEEATSKLNQRVYFLSKGQGLVERYKINEVVTARVLSKYGVPFEEQRNDFLNRRADFQGSEIRVLVERKKPFLDIAPLISGEEERKVLNDEEYYHIDPTRLSGIYKDLMDILSERLNFTAAFYRRPDKLWGKKVGERWIGGVGGLVRGDVDIIGSSLTLKPDRAEVIDYLIPVGRSFNALFIRNNLATVTHWRIFVDPFSTNLWAFLFAVIAVNTVVIRSLEAWYIRRCECGPGSALTTLETLWTLFSFHFGKAPPQHLGLMRRLPMKIFVFCILLVGSVIFMSYRASLTSGLSTVAYRLPFESLEGLLASDYKLLVKGGGSTASSFEKAGEDTILGRIYDKFIRPDPSAVFTSSISDALAAVVYEATGKMAFMYQIETVREYKEFQCDLLVAWRSHVPVLNSMAFGKDSVYKPFIDGFVMNMLEDGSVDLITKKWKSEGAADSCREHRNMSLGFEKLASLFAILVAGSLAAILSWAAEFAWSIMATNTSSEGQPDPTEIGHRLNEVGEKLTRAMKTARENNCNEMNDDIIRDLTSLIGTMKTQKKLFKSVSPSKT